MTPGRSIRGGAGGSPHNPRTDELFGGAPRQLYRYLGRYTHRVGLSNERLLLVTERSVTIRTRTGTASFASHEFLRRFLQHLPPKGFVRVRHFGLFATVHTRRLQTAQELLETSRVSDHESESAAQDDVVKEQCPACMFGRLVRDEVEPDLSQEQLWDP